MPSVLLCEDNDPLRTAMRTLLVVRGYDCVEASTGRTGLQLLRRHVPDAIVVDLKLPEVSGLEVILWARRQYPDLRILAVSGMPDRYLQEALRAGADYFLRKPFAPAEILDAVERTLGGERIEPADEPVGFSA